MSETSSTARCSVCHQAFGPKGLAIHMGRKHAPEPCAERVRELEELLAHAHDVHGFSSEHCTPANCTIEKYLTEHGIGWRFRGWDRPVEERAALATAQGGEQ